VDEQPGIGDNVRSGKTEQRIGLRVPIVLGAADGKSNNALAKELKTSRPTVLDWRQRFAEGGIQALYDDRPRGAEFQAVGSHRKPRLLPRRKALSPRPHNGVAAAWRKSAASAKHRCSASGMPTA
jgi:hypothetical protein